MKTYILTKLEKNAEKYIGECSNKKLAIMTARKWALANKYSVLVTKVTNNNKQLIGIAEYPYYLRNLELDLTDIDFNNIEPY